MAGRLGSPVICLLGSLHLILLLTYSPRSLAGPVTSARGLQGGVLGHMKKPARLGIVSCEGAER